MAVKLLFEDNDKTPSSYLLRGSGFGKHMEFSCGARKLLAKAIDLRDEGNIVYALYDLVPNNVRTISRYDDMLGWMKNKFIYQDIYIVPIICIEYYICCYLYAHHLLAVRDSLNPLVDSVIASFDYANVPEKYQKDIYTGSSLEHMYKFILEEHKMQCFHNHFKYSTNGTLRDYESVSGIFYERDCVCERKYCGVNCTEKHQVKAEFLCHELPIFFVNGSSHEKILRELGLFFQENSYEEIMEERQNFYNRVCDSMGVRRLRVI